MGAAAVDVVVDSDGFDAVCCHVAVHAPGRGALPPVPRRRRDRTSLRLRARSRRRRWPSSARAMRCWRRCRRPRCRRHFATFCGIYATAAADADNLAELITIARRRYEAAAGTGYLEAAAHASRAYPSLRDASSRHRARRAALRRRLQRGARPVPGVPRRASSPSRSRISRRRRRASSCRCGICSTTDGRACGRSPSRRWARCSRAARQSPSCHAIRGRALDVLEHRASSRAEGARAHDVPAPVRATCSSMASAVDATTR